MRIQHNIMAMNAYRNYTNNVSAMKKNLERLSSGYKINRAGDDAAGLAISEKMRAQITGLETAQKNAKDGISLVQTAEGALTEVHDMLNRMVELASQSANGTYDNTTDRAQLQKEMDQLKAEINRIADSSNFNGIKLLDGSMDAESAQAQYTALTKDQIIDIMLPAPTSGAGSAANVGKETILETNSIDVKNPSFEVSFDGVKHGIETGAAAQKLTLTVGGVAIDLTEDKMGGAVGDELTGTQLAQLFADQGTGITNGKIDIGGKQYEVTASGDRLVFTMTDDATKGVPGLDQTKESTFHYDVKLTSNVAAKTTTSKNTYTSGTYEAAAAGSAQDAAGKIEVTAKAGDKTYTFEIAANALTAGATLATNLGAATDKTDNTTTLSSLFDVSYDTGDKVFKLVAKDTGDAAGKVTAFTVTPATVTTGTAPTYDATGAGSVDGKTSSTGTSGYLNAGGEVNVTYTPTEPDQLASTTLNLAGKLDDGARLRLGDTTYVIAKGEDSAFANVKGEGIVVVKANADDSDELVASKLTEAAKQDNETFTVSHQANTAQIGIKQKAAVKGTTDMTTMDKLASYIGLSTVDKVDAEGNDIAKPVAGKGLTLQIGDTAESFNQLTVNIKDMHVSSLGLEGVSIADQDSAAKAIDAIKAAINSVSDVRGTLGATQNRLDHTINNLSVMTENIQDAESTIRDVDIAEEMMAYTKNNILIQSAQAMLAQANQVPQGVLQLLQ